MKDDEPVPLDRSFSAVLGSAGASDEQEVLEGWGLYEPKRWPHIDEGYRSVILAEAGAGKTFEMLARAYCLEEGGQFAFFIRIEDIGENFEDAFEVGSAKSFEQWLSSQREAWFYLDSVDEARLWHPKAFEKAIRRFAARIRDAQLRAHICIASRPYAWRPKADYELIKRHLPFEKRRTEPKGEISDVFKPAGQPERLLPIYWLRPLDEKEIRRFAAHRSTPNIDGLMAELQRLNLLGLAARPFDLEGILDKWAADGALGSRSELLRYNIESRLKEPDPARLSQQFLSLEKAREGARTLAAAVILTGEAGIRVPDTTYEQKGIDAETVLADWSPRDVQDLLQRPVFDDAIYGAVRFRHREVREMLAADWLLELLEKGNARHKIERLIFREQYGEEFIAPRLRPVLPWLILEDERIRNRALALDPDIAVEGGDPVRLSFPQRKRILADIVEQIVQEGKKSNVHDNSAIDLIAKADLTRETRVLINRHSDNDDVIFFLGRLVWRGEMSDCLPPMLDIAADPARGIYARIAASRAVVTCGTIEQQHTLWNRWLTAQTELPHQLLAELLQSDAPDATNVDLLLESINKLAPNNRYQPTGLRHSLHRFIDRIPCPPNPDVNQPLAKLVDVLAGFLGRPPYIDSRHCRISKEFAWLLGAAVHAVERLTSARAKEAMEDPAIVVMLENPAVREWQVPDLDEHEVRLGELVPAWPELNDALFWRSIATTRIRLEKEGKRLHSVVQVQWPRHYWDFGTDAFPRVLDWVKSRPLEDDRLVALSLAFRIHREGGETQETFEQLRSAATGDEALERRLDEFLNPTVSEAEQEWQQRDLERKQQQERRNSEREQERSEMIAQLKADPDRVRNPPGLQPGQISNNQFCLFSEVEGSGQRTSRSEGSAWESLIDEFGEDVASAYRDAAMNHWRNYKPRFRSEGVSTDSISNYLLFAMGGLEMEAREVDGFPEHLSESEVRHALRYIIWELNGFPSWLEVMYQAHPEAVMEVLQTELFWELSDTQPDQPTPYVLDDLIHYAPWLHGAVAEPLLAWVREHDPASDNALHNIIGILRGGGSDPGKLAEVAQSKIAADPPDEHAPYWYALWVDAEPDTGVIAVARWLNDLGSRDLSSLAAQVFVSVLLRTLGGRAFGLNIGNYRTAEHLKTLYVLMHEHIPVGEDTDRAGRGVYTPGLRDNAQEARNGLFKFLAERPGKRTHVAITELIKEHPEPDYRSWMEKEARKRAEQDGDLEPFTAEQVHEFSSRLTRSPASHLQLFDLTIGRLTDLKDWLEQGDDSPFRNWKRAKDEAEMRSLVASELNRVRGNTYTIAQEAELANRQRSDIWLQNPNVELPIPIELKLLDQGWTGPELCERLQNQLAGDYLRQGYDRCGVLLLVWKGSKRGRRWRVGGKLVGVEELREEIKKYWAEIANDFPKVAAIEVIVIDLDARANKLDNQSEG